MHRGVARDRAGRPRYTAAGFGRREGKAIMPRNPRTVDHGRHLLIALRSQPREQAPAVIFVRRAGLSRARPGGVG